MSQLNNVFGKRRITDMEYELGVHLKVPRIDADVLYLNNQPILPPSITTLTPVAGELDTDGAVGATFEATLTEATELKNPTNIIVGQTYTWVVDVGTPANTMTFDTYFTFAGGVTPTLSTTDGDKDTLRGVAVSATEIVLDLAHAGGGGGGGGGGSWSPSDITTELWLDASDGSTITHGSGSLVSQWDDKSGNGYHFSEATLQPTILNSADFNHKHVIDFNSGKQLQQSGPATIAWYITVIKFPAGTTACNLHCMLGSVTTAERMGGIRNWTNLGFHTDVLPSALWVNGVSYTPSNTWPLANVDTVQLVAITTNPDRGGGTPGVSTTTDLIIGNHGTHSSGYTGLAQQAEIIALSTIPDASTRVTLEGYLAWKYGLQGVLPSTHIYKNSAP